VKVKICGLRSADDARVVAAAGVDLAGLVLVPGSRRHLGLDDARRVRDALGDVEPVAVFRDAPIEVLDAAIDALAVTWVQLHGDEPLDVVRHVAARCVVIRAVARDRVHHLDVGALAPHVAAFLVDGAEPGSGRPVDHRGIDVGRLGGRPLFVAGGLDPDNVAAVVERVRPQGVDVATGVTEGGALSSARVHAFVEQARSAARRRVS